MEDVSASRGDHRLVAGEGRHAAGRDLRPLQHGRQCPTTDRNGGWLHFGMRGG